jgi:hypothetical protein
LKPDRPFWLRRQEELPPGVEVRPTWKKQEIATIRRLTLATILEWAEMALGASGCNADAQICWQELAFSSFRVRLPDNIDVPPGGLHLKQGAGAMRHPVERRDGEIHVFGPIATTLNAPLEVAVRNESGLLTFDLMLHWSILSEPGSQGLMPTFSAPSSVSGSGDGC